MANKRDRHFKNGKDFRKTLLSYRRYSAVVSVIEVFCRVGMGERYFNGRNFLGGLVGLIVFRFFIASSKVHYFDVFITLYILLSLYHFIVQWRRRAKRNSHYSYFLGYSRFEFIAKAMRFKDTQYVTYKFIEPLIVLLLVLPIMTYSFFLGIVAIIGAGRLWWENSKVLAREWQEHLDRRDNEIYATHVRQNMTDIGDSKVIAPSHVKAKQPKKQKNNSINQPKRATPSVQEALNNLSPKLKSLGKKGNENTTS